MGVLYIQMWLIQSTDNYRLFVQLLGMWFEICVDSSRFMRIDLKGLIAMDVPMPHVLKLAS